MDRRRVELPTSALRMCDDVVLSDADKELTATDMSVCTSVCTNDAQNEKAGISDADQRQKPEAITDPIATLATALLALSSVDRARLAVMLLKNG